jgi:two-component system, chemotaxis family, sensor kinase CheA
MDEIVKEFLIESYENLDKLDRALVELEKDPTHRPSLDSVFRTIHTIKGTCGFLGFGKLERVAHVGENLLSQMREGKMVLNEEITSALLAMVDAVRAVLAVIESTGAEGDQEYPELIELLTSLASGESKAAPAPVVPVKFQEPAPAAVVPEPAAATAPVPEVAPAVPVSAAPAAPAQPAPEKAEGSRSMSDSTVRVDVSLLDKLMNLVGELVLGRNQILQLANTYTDTAFINVGQRLNLITTELQENVMKTRMQPIANVWNKFPRVVRDVAGELGKKVHLEMVGKETELDRTIIEAIKDPLTHIIRNSVDHGLELPATRTEIGKPEIGSLVLKAFHEGGQVNIEIIDDGAGIHVGRVKDKCVSMGVLTSEQAARMSDREAMGLIFHPGLSTAAKISNVSGRGVGMDVVRTNIEKIGGSVDVLSEVGRGTTIKIKIPLTLAIIPALIITSGSERFAIPQVNLVELVRMDPSQERKGIERIYGVPVYRLRGNLLPLIYLNSELKLKTKDGASRQPADDNDAVNIVVLEADGRQFGMVVDTINDTEEIVVKPLGKQLKSLNCFAGATIMGDGRVALILDVLGLAQQSQVISPEREHAMHEEGSKRPAPSEEKQSLLLFNVGDKRRMVIPLSMVARLEEVPRAEVEWTGNQEVIQYRGQIIPLIRVAEYLDSRGGPNGGEEDPMQVVVYTENDRSVGLIVGQINDIVQESLVIQRQGGQRGVLGSTVIQDRVTDLLDIAGIIRSADPGFYVNKDQTAALVANA